MKMRTIASSLVLLGMCAAPVFAAGVTYKDVPVIDVGCSKKAAADPDAHTRACALQCAGSGFGILTKDQHFLKFDSAGNARIEEELKASNKKDHLRVNVDGKVEGGTLKVTSVTLL